jgi:hypothetical protein
VCLTDGDAVAALYAGSQFLFDVWELVKYVHSNTFFPQKQRRVTTISPL